ncbi:CCA tRNA nucleotidyltransferase [candidate division WOR-3 bacterium]|uniref:CCA tRNA nucleotidyltransferase n=1 Tax=candidate division WOR-3 bacterium TaxID=2052148 RepID=A0A938BU15_UNCW3|nr:CCA tRNA nucleotidyltransferase [candidate division WOR-3 bacterium]
MTNSRAPADGERPPLALPNRELIERLGEIANHLGTRSFLVGGPVRDLLFGRTKKGVPRRGTKTQRGSESETLVTGSPGGEIPTSSGLQDIDVAVEEGCREFGAAVAKEFGGRLVYHSRFLTGTVLFDRPQASSVKPQAVEHIDITQTRAESYERPAVLPAVRPASIVGDLGRRDFTINAMALEITPGAFGEFIDPFDGRADLEHRRVRTLHARSFSDDPTRIFRCLRFAARLGFKIEPQTADLMRSAVEQRLPAFLTPERLLYELRAICAEPLVLPIVKSVIRERLLEAALRWTPPRGFVDGLERLVRNRLPPELLFIYWLSVLPVTERFPIRKEERDAAAAVAGFGKLRPWLRRKLKPSGVYRILRSVPEPALAVLAPLETRPVSTSISAFLDNYRRVGIAATGADLRAAGLKPGPAYREILDQLLFARLDGRIRSVTEERALLQRLAHPKVG